MIVWERGVELLDRVQSGVWVALAVANLVMTIGTWSTARRRMRRAGQRVADPGLVPGAARVRDTALTVAAMVPAVLFWAMVLAGSLHGLVAFGRQMLGWHDGWGYLVPGTLDGVSVTFAFLAFRAVRRQKAPDRCYRVVWGAAVASATVNFAYEYGHSGYNLVAGGYLALLSLFGMVMFHEFLDQFEEGAAYVKRANPRFGLRWITWPTNTFCAAVAWRNHPPVEGTRATIREAVANLDRVRTAKAAAREAVVVARHERDLARERRRTELAAAQIEAPDEAAKIATASASLLPRSAMPTARLRIPATTATLTQWMDTWVRMCADGHLALGEQVGSRARGPGDRQPGHGSPFVTVKGCSVQAHVWPP